MKSLFVSVALLFSAFAFADTTVPVPPEPKETFLLQGEIGYNEVPWIFLYSYNVRSDGTIEPGSTGFSSPIRGDVNKTIHAPPGLYMVDFESTYALIEIKPGQHLTMKISHIRIPKAPDGYEGMLFSDYGANGQQDKILLYFIAQSQPGATTGVPAGSWADQFLKPLYDSGDLKKVAPELRTGMFKDGQRCKYDSSTGEPESYCSYDYVGGGQFSGSSSIAVLPGTYGISWTLPNSTTSIQRGIVVK
jgi:hypothetical protein